MKIIIIALPRTGSSSLMNEIGKQGYYKISEPYNHTFGGNLKNEYPLKELIKEKLVVKNMIFDKPHKKYIDKDIFDMWKDITEHFDRTILLDRSDNKEHLESFISLKYRYETGQLEHSKWHSSMIPQSWRKKFIIQNDHQHLYDMKADIQKLSILLNTEITCYEELYGEDRNKSLEIIKSWNLNIDAELLNEDLHPRNKQRYYKKSTI